MPLSLLPLFLISFQASPPKEAVDLAAKDLKLLQGKYVMEALEVNGVKVPLNKLEGTFLTIKGDSYTVHVKDKTIPCQIVLDPKQDPKHLDMVFKEGEKKDKTHKAIYRIDGERLLVARGLGAEQERPNQFATWPDTNYFVVTWRRQE